LIKRVTDVGFTCVVVRAVVASEALGVVTTAIIGIGAGEVCKRANTALTIKVGTEGGFGDASATVAFAASDTVGGLGGFSTDVGVHAFARSNLANTCVTGFVGAWVRSTSVVGTAIEVAKAVCVGRTTHWVNTGTICTHTALTRVITRNHGFAGGHVASETFQTKIVVPRTIRGVDALACGLFAYSTFAGYVFAEVCLCVVITAGGEGGEGQAHTEQGRPQAIKWYSDSSDHGSISLGGWRSFIPKNTLLTRDTRPLMAAIQGNPLEELGQIRALRP